MGETFHFAKFGWLGQEVSAKQAVGSSNNPHGQSTLIWGVSCLSIQDNIELGASEIDSKNLV